jgi:hypothetical protein
MSRAMTEIRGEGCPGARSQTTLCSSAAKEVIAHEASKSQTGQNSDAIRAPMVGGAYASGESECFITPIHEAH